MVGDLELVKDYNYTILYHSGKANAIIDTLSRKLGGQLANLVLDEDQLVQYFEKIGVRLDQIRGRILSCRQIRY